MESARTLIIATLGPASLKTDILQRLFEAGVDVFRVHHPGEPGHYTYWDYRVRAPIERGIGWRVDHIWATMPLAAKSINAWIDVEARKAERPSDHTFLVAEFEI